MIHSIFSFVDELNVIANPIFSMFVPLFTLCTSFSLLTIEMVILESNTLCFGVKSITFFTLFAVLERIADIRFAVSTVHGIGRFDGFVHIVLHRPETSFGFARFGFHDICVGMVPLSTQCSTICIVHDEKGAETISSHRVLVHSNELGSIRRGKSSNRTSVKISSKSWNFNSSRTFRCWRAFIRPSCYCGVSIDQVGTERLKPQMIRNENSHFPHNFTCFCCFKCFSHLSPIFFGTFNFSR